MDGYVVVDAHEDLAWNGLSFGRDYRRPALATRALEAGGPTPGHNGNTLLGYADWLLGRVGLVFATLFASPLRRKKGTWDTQSYASPEEARLKYQAQMDYYRRWAGQSQGRLHLVERASDLEQVLATWRDEDLARRCMGLLVLMEGAEGILAPGEVEGWARQGVRAIGPAWASNRYCGGTGEPGPLTRAGHELLRAMDSAGLVLDLSHMDESAANEALDAFAGTVIASHSNARLLIKGHPHPNRHLSDEMIGRIAERDGVVGAVLYNPFLKGDWKRAEGKSAVPLALFLDQIDHMCQVVGSASHVALGSDFDGGFGVEATPAEIDTIADLGCIAAGLRQRGFSAPQIGAVLGENWLRVVRRALA